MAVVGADEHILCAPSWLGRRQAKSLSLFREPLYRDLRIQKLNRFQSCDLYEPSICAHEYDSLRRAYSHASAEMKRVQCSKGLSRTVLLQQILGVLR